MEFIPCLVGVFLLVESAFCVNEKLYLGCYSDEGDRRDLSTLVWSRANSATIDSCIYSCRHQSFKFAGLQNGKHCFCSNQYTRIYSNSTQCNVRCSGDKSQICGGQKQNSVYFAPTDSKYLGCYNDESESPDLPMTLWTASARRSAAECVQACARRGYRYAGVRAGGTCSCGAGYGKHGVADEHECTYRGVRCAADAERSCGGVTQNAVYDTEKSYKITEVMSVESSVVNRINDLKSNVVGLPTRMFRRFRNLRSFVSKRLVIHSNEPPKVIFEAPRCGAKDCYESCGNMAQPRGLKYTGSDVTLRFFRFRVSHLNQYVGADTKRVYLHAQTLVLDDNINAAYSLLINAREIVIDYSKSRTIRVGTSSPELNIDFDAAVFLGASDDLLHQKQSFMCARILLENSVRKGGQNEVQKLNDRDLAWMIMADIAGKNAATTEQLNYQLQVRSYMTSVAGIDRSNLHFIPFHTKSFLSETLALHEQRISLYRDKFSRVVDRATSDSEYLQLVSQMIQIYSDTDLNEAERAYQASVTALRTANFTYLTIAEEFQMAKVRLNQSREVLEKVLEEMEDDITFEVLATFNEAIIQTVWGVFSGDWFDVVEGLTTIIGPMLGFKEALGEVSVAIRQLDDFVDGMSELDRALMRAENAKEVASYMDDIDRIVKLRTSLVYWQNLKENAQVFFSHPVVKKVQAAESYHHSLNDLTNWGVSLTNTMIEKAELSRRTAQKKFSLASKKEEVKRLTELLEKTKKDVASYRDEMTSKMAEQTYQVRLDLNEVLYTFCQAFYFENLAECKPLYRPSFGGDLDELLFKINEARSDGIFIDDAPSSLAREVEISDTDRDVNCSDSSVCPINYLKRYKRLQYSLPVNASSLSDIDKYRVQEVRFRFNGAQPSATNTKLKVRIDSAGVFQDRARGVVHDFVTNSLRLGYEYDLITGEISIHADVAKPFRNMVTHLTPFTTWNLKISEQRSSDINLDGVTSITMRLIGSGKDNEGRLAKKTH